jgi:signal transduction histidine kinase
MVALALVGGAVFSRAALRRIETINRTFLEVAEGNFSRRVPTRGTRDELDRLAVNINQMLERIEHLLDNLQQVTNDIAHDLRTPLGHLRQGLEGARLKGVSVEEYQTAIDHAIEEVDTILETFAALLRIAQVESRSRRDRFTDVDLSEVSNRVIDAYESVVEDAGQTLTWSIANGIEVRGDKNLLAQLLANLIENASRHCPTGTPIRVSLGSDPAPVLEVADNGPGIPADMREAVLRRFVRLEQSRTSPGSGLGLAVVKAIADLHDARLKLDDNGPGLRVTLTFPALQPVNPNS